MDTTADDVAMTHGEDDHFGDFDGVPEFHNFGEDENVPDDGDNDDSFFGEERRSSVLPDSDLTAPAPNAAVENQANPDARSDHPPVALACTSAR